MSKFIVSILFLIVFFTINTSATGSPDDTGFWSSARIVQPLGYGFRITLRQDMRLHNDWSSLNQTFNEFSLGFKANDNLSFGAKYRLGQRESTFSPTHIDQRYSIEMTLEQEFSDLEIAWRSRTQFRYRDLGRRENSYIPKNYWRNKFTISYRLNKRIKPFASYESFNEFSYDTKQYNKYRLSFGTRVRFNKSNSLRISYIFQNSINTDLPLLENILSLSYSYKLSKIAN